MYLKAKIDHVQCICETRLLMSVIEGERRIHPPLTDTGALKSNKDRITKWQLKSSRLRALDFLDV